MGNITEKYFDMHSHILPGIDDGADTLQETCRMLDMAYKEGIRYICATPHYRRNIEAEAVEKFRKVFSAVQKETKKRYPDMLLFAGNELLYSYGIAEDLDMHKALTLNAGRYALIEFLPDASYKTVCRGLEELMSHCYVPVIAHVERLGCLYRQWDRLETLKNMYIVFQMNTSSITGGMLDIKARYCRRLIKSGYIDILGTDCHNAAGRSPKYREAAQWIEKNCGEQALLKLTYDNPKAILNDEILK